MEVMTEFVTHGGTVLASPLLPEFAAEGPEEDHRIREMMETIRAAGALGGSEPGSSPVAYLVRSRALPECILDPACPNILCTTIARPEGEAFLLVNVSPREYAGTVAFRTDGKPTLLDPVTDIEHALATDRTADSRSRVRLTLPPFGSLAILFARG
jgi:hypothetical protein